MLLRPYMCFFKYIFFHNSNSATSWRQSLYLGLDWQQHHFWLCASSQSHRWSKPLSILWVHSLVSVYLQTCLLLCCFSIIDMLIEVLLGQYNCAVLCKLTTFFTFQVSTRGPWHRGDTQGLLLSRLFFSCVFMFLGSSGDPLPLSAPLHPLPPRPATPIAFLPCRQRRWHQPFQIARPLAQQRLSVPQYPCEFSIKVLITSEDR